MEGSEIKAVQHRSPPQRSNSNCVWNQMKSIKLIPSKSIQRNVQRATLYCISTVHTRGKESEWEYSQKEHCPKTTQKDVQKANPLSSHCNLGQGGKKIEWNLKETHSMQENSTQRAMPNEREWFQHRFGHPVPKGENKQTKKYIEGGSGDPSSWPANIDNIKIVWQCVSYSGDPANSSPCPTPKLFAKWKTTHSATALVQTKMRTNMHPPLH